jgi:DegV family protein with EDD domain
MSKQKIAIVTDSTASIPAQACAGLKISVIPVWMLWDGENFRDGVDIQPEAFYQRLRRSKTLPTTSQPSPGEFVNFYQQVAAQGADVIISVLVSSKISGTVASAQAAKAELPHLDIRIVDSHSTTMGLGLVVLAAARAVAEGRSADDVVALAERCSAGMQVLFVVDTLEYLFKGGRISGGKHLLGTALNIKPILHIQDGQIKPLTQARSKPKAIARVLEIAAERLAGREMAESAVVDVDSPAEGEMLAGMVKQHFAPASPLRAGVSPVVGTHAGPGTVGIAFYAKG